MNAPMCLSIILVSPWELLGYIYQRDSSGLTKTACCYWMWVFSCYRTCGRDHSSLEYLTCKKNLMPWIMVQLFALKVPAHLKGSKQNCLHCDTTSIGFGQHIWTSLQSASQARLLQSAVGSIIYNSGIHYNQSCFS